MVPGAGRTNSTLIAPSSNMSSYLYLCIIISNILSRIGGGGGGGGADHVVRVEFVVYPMFLVCCLVVYAILLRSLLNC